MVVFASASEVRGPQLQIERRESHWLLRAGNRFEKRVIASDGWRRGCIVGGVMALVFVVHGPGRFS